MSDTSSQTDTGLSTTDTDASTGSEDECIADNCKVDQDHDGVAIFCDNSPDAYNPSQADMDGDGYGDIDDLCPTLASQQNTADSDRDGVGNECDVCSRTVNQYNLNDSIPPYLQVRGNPSQQDSDRDGIGDACDNCVAVPNCQGYGDGDGLTPHEVGAPLDDEAADCQADADFNGIGDACDGYMSPGSAGRVGFAPTDDFDQDGLANAEDGCPRLAVAPIACTDDGDCPSGATCTAGGLCGHPDHDGDLVGDACDTCLNTPNPNQAQAGGSEDDIDQDFIGKLCEQNSLCDTRKNPRAHAYYDVHVNGRCCATLYDIYHGDGVHDPFGQPVDVLAMGQRPPGATELPPGCEEALADAPNGIAHPVTVEDVGSLAAMRPYLCMLAAPDQDFDRTPDVCDLCRYTFDPGQEPYVDGNGKLWPDFGKYCEGEHNPEFWDIDNSCWPSP